MISDSASLSANEIDLSATEFWLRPLSERQEAFRVLRHDLPIGHYDTPILAGSTLDLAPDDGYYALTRYADVAEASRRPDVFISGPGAVSIIDFPPEIVEYFSGMVSTDNPKHARLRRIVSRAFSPKNIRAVEESIDRVADDVLNRARSGGTGDFIADIAAPFPLEIICSMMGVPRSEYATVQKCSNVILSMGDSEFIPDGSDPTVAFIEAGATLTGIMDELATFRVDQPIDDITSALVNAEIASEKLTKQELASFFVLLVTAGSETTRTAIAHALIAFDDFPDQKKLLTDDFEGLAKTATDEILRWATPITWMRRTLDADYTLSGFELKKNDKVVMFYNSANRDENAFVDPLKFDVARTPNDHFSFGAPGPHVCLGSHLARREITVMWRDLLARTPSIHHTGPPARLSSSFVNGIKHVDYSF
ncbi:MAG TPA: cytochrome P450 [Acidimicrobiales bacterium]|nr:cytochrome P450 [Acidimicrobiales bacterium]